MVENKCGNVCIQKHTDTCVYLEYVITQTENINSFLCVNIGHPLTALDQEILKSLVVYLGIMFVKGRRHRLCESGNIRPFFSNTHHSPMS